MINENAIETNNLSVSYGDITALDNLNITIPAGSVVSIVGPNGSGKTSFLKVLLRIIKPSRGSLKIFGNSIDKNPSGLIGYVPQIKTGDKSFPATAIELVLSGKGHKWFASKSKDDKNKAIASLELVGAADIANRQISELSGGQLQRVYLARCFISSPRLLLLDEPATGIDLVCESSINSIIEEYNKKHGITVIMVTHDWSAAYHHSSLVLLINKRQVFFGMPDKAFTDINLQQTFSHLGHKHNVTFGIKK